MSSHTGKKKVFLRFFAPIWGMVHFFGKIRFQSQNPTPSPAPFFKGRGVCYMQFWYTSALVCQNCEKNKAPPSLAAVRGTGNGGRQFCSNRLKKGPGVC